MVAICYIYFNKIPSFEIFLLELKGVSGLDFDIEISEYSLAISAKNCENSLEEIDIYDESRERKLNPFNIEYPKGNYLIVNFHVSEIPYLESVVLAVLKDLGGTYENGKEIILPAWAKEKWQGIDWWKKVRNKERWWWKLIRK